MKSLLYLACKHLALVVPHAGTWIEILFLHLLDIFEPVVPHAGTWIEIRHLTDTAQETSVVPHAGTWIEIVNARANMHVYWSFPTRERGLKSCWNINCISNLTVVPHAGTWIEIIDIIGFCTTASVVPHAGTWIEIKIQWR